jgi:hypothetical protein
LLAAYATTLASVVLMSVSSESAAEAGPRYTRYPSTSASSVEAVHDNVVEEEVRPDVAVNAPGWDGGALAALAGTVSRPTDSADPTMRQVATTRYVSRRGTRRG